MFIIWGQTTIDFPRGWVGDHCPVCRRITRQRARQRRLIPHVYFIPVWVGRAVCWITRCAECRTRFARPHPFYVKRGRRSQTPMELLALTNPIPPAELEAMLLRDEAIEQRRCEPAERAAYLTEVLARLGFEIEKRVRGSGGESIRALLLLGLVAVLAVCAGAWVGGSVWRWPLSVLAAGNLAWLIRHEVSGRVRSREKIVGALLARARLVDGADPALLAAALGELADAGADWARRLQPERMARVVSERLALDAGVSPASPFRAAA